MAANETVSLIVKLLADGVQFTKTMDDARAKATRTGQDIARSIQDVSGKVAAGATVFGGAIVGSLALAGKGAADFQNDMSGVVALLDKEVRTPAMVKSLTDGARSIRTEFGITGPEVAEAMRTAVGSGIEAADAVGFLATSAKAAVSGMVPLKDVVGVTAKTVKAFGLEAKDAGRVQDALAKAVNLGTVEWSDFATGLGAVVPFAKMSGMSVEELAGTIADLTLKGFPADQAMSSLKAMFVSLQNPQKQAKDMFDRLGISLRDATGHARPALEILNDIKTKLREQGVINIIDEKALKKENGKLKTLQDRIVKLKAELMEGGKTGKQKSVIAKKLEEANAALAKTQGGVDKIMNTVKERLDKDGTVASLIGDVNGKAVAVSLLSDDMAGLDKTLLQMKDSAGAVNEQFEGFTQNNAKFDMAKMREEFQNTKERIGDAAITIFLPLAKSFADIVKAIGEWVAANPGWTKAIVAVVGTVGGLALVLGGLSFTLGKIAGLYLTITGLSTAMAGGFTAVGIEGGVAAAGATAAGAGAATGSIGFWAMAAAVWATLWPIGLIVLAVVAVIAILYGLYKLLEWAAQTKPGKVFFDFLVYCWDGIKMAFNSFVDFLSPFFMGVGEILMGVLEFLGGIFTGFFELIGEILTGKWGAIKERFIGMGEDIKDAFGSAIDWVMDKINFLLDAVSAAASAAGDFLNPFSDGGGGGAAAATKAPGFAKGGIVTRKTLAYVGEEGPEAIIPLRGGGVPVIMRKGEPAGTAAGSSGQPVNITNNIYQQPGQSMTQLADEVARVTLRRRGL